MNKSYTLSIILFSVLLALLSGCMNTKKSEPVTLYVQTYDRSDFMQDYGIPFELQYDKEIRIEPVVYGYEGYPDTHADIISIDGFLGYEEKVSNNELALLDVFAQRDEMNWSQAG